MTKLKYFESILREVEGGENVSLELLVYPVEISFKFKTNMLSK